MRLSGYLFQRLSEQIKFSYSDFDEKGGFFRILDIYQNEIIVSCGKKEGFSKGDYLEILDSSTGRAGRENYSDCIR